jgi:transcriptional regulator with XRE-family HTH domain
MTTPSSPSELRGRRLPKQQPPKRPSEMFAEQMRIQRERKGWTQKQLAIRLAKLGFLVHQTTIGKWEAGERRITLDEALAISVALDVGPAHMLAGSYLDARFSRPSVALSAKTPPVSARQMRMWVRGEQTLWGQDEKRYYTEVAPDEWLAMQRAGVRGLVRSVQELVDAWADGDSESAGEIIEAISDEIGRQRRALDRELSKETRRRELVARGGKANRSQRR